MEVIWTESAKKSLHLILEYLQSTFSSKTAFEARTLIFDSVENLRFFPLMGQYYFDAIQNIPIRYLVVKKSKIFYYIEESKIIVFLIWDTRQDPDILKTLLQNVI